MLEICNQNLKKPFFKFTKRDLVIYAEKSKMYNIFICLFL